MDWCFSEPRTLPYSKEPTRIAGEDCAEADRFAANLLPIICEAQKAGTADVLNAGGGSRRRMKLPGAMLRGSGPRCAGVAFASNVGEFARPLRRRHEIVAYATRHDHIPGNDPQLTALSRFAFDDVVGPNREPRGKPRLHTHNERSVVWP
jgi:hypothetical protein